MMYIKVTTEELKKVKSVNVNNMKSNIKNGVQYSGLLPVYVVVNKQLVK